MQGAVFFVGEAFRKNALTRLYAVFIIIGIFG